jgi:hypothetical protein
MSRTTSFAAAVSVLGLLALAACAGQTTDDGTAADDGTSAEEQDLIKSVGKMCGGIAGIKCKAGLNCIITAKHPDASGTCQKPKAGEEGALCGGIAGLQCKPGFKCVMDTSGQSGGPPPGAMGMPSKPGSSGGPPPGAVGLPFPDQSGTCTAVSSGPPPGAMGLPKPQ